MSDWTPLPGQITAEDVVGFVTDQGLFTDFGFTGVASTDGKMPTAPDRLVIVTMYGGTGYSSDATIDNVKFQFRARGGQADYASASEMIWAIDGLLCPFVPLPPGMVGRQLVQQISRATGTPAFFTRDSGNRAQYVSSYNFAVSRVPVTT